MLQPASYLQYFFQLCVLYLRLTFYISINNIFVAYYLLGVSYYALLLNE